MPNCQCVVCERPLYRRPNELAKVRHVACMEHRAEAQRREGLTAKQIAALALGRQPGDNGLTGIPKSEASKRKRSVSQARWCRENPAGLTARGAKIRGEAHYRWNGGISKLNLSIRQMTENRKWMAAVKARDGLCVECGSTDQLEAHHVIPMAELLASLKVQSRDDARRHAGALWDTSNGRTLCGRCHYKHHGRRYAA